MPSLKFVIIGTSVSYVFFLLLVKIYLRLVEVGVAVPVFNHYPGKCRVIPGLECGSEDFAVTKDGLAFISNGLRVIPKCDFSVNKGSLYLFDFKNPDANVSKLEIVSETINFAKFDPHGLSSWEHPESQKIFVFLIDHGNGDEMVHIFEYDRDEPKKLLHKESITDQTFNCINDLVATGPRSFYITNFIAYCKYTHHAVALEFFMGLKTGNVVYFDGEQGKIVATGFGQSNGINMSPDGKYVYVAVGGELKLAIMKRDVETNDISLVKKLPLMTSPDNLEVDKDSGDIFIGAHRNYKLPFANYNGTFVAPAHVIRVHCPEEKWDECIVREVLSSDGIDFVRGTSVAHFYKGGLLVGTVYHRLGYCGDVHIS